MKKTYDKNYVDNHQELQQIFNNLYDIIAFKTISGLIAWDYSDENSEIIYFSNSGVTIHINKDTNENKFIIMDENDERTFLNLDLTKMLKAINYVIDQQEAQSLMDFVKNFRGKI